MPQIKRVIQLNTITDTDPTIVGAKALSLVKLGRIGLPVPAGFCVTAAACRAHLDRGDVLPEVRAAMEDLENAVPQSKREILCHVRETISKSAISEALHKEIVQNYKTLGAVRVAVRSSATAEDLPGHSFAGLHDTYLGIGSMDECIDAIKKCWASLWTERAYEYRQKNAFDHLKANMAVIVQALIPAEASGVIFTADPATGRRERIVIEACFGLGNPLVSGKVTPDRFVIDKKSLKQLSQTVSEKKIESVLDEAASIKEQTVPADRASNRSISKSTVRKLAKLAKRVEAEFGCPQDIEWALRGRKIYLLQSRPITALPPPKSWEDLQVWTNANTGEVIPDVVTPFAWSVIQTLLDEVFDRTLGLVGIKRGNNPLFGVVAGRIYFNVNTLIAVTKQFPRGQLWDLNELFGGEQAKMYRLGQICISDEEIPRLRFSLGKFMLNMPGLVIRILMYRPSKGQRMIAELADKVYEVQKMNITAMSDQNLAKHLVGQISDLRSHLADVRHGAIYALIGMWAFLMLDKVCRKWFGEEASTFANRLLAGVGDMDSARAGHDLWRLALKAHEIAGVERFILEGDNWAKTREKISKFQRAEEFLARWDEFMIRHGHHCRGEIEPYNARWRETPDYVLGLVRSYIGCIGDTDPIGEYEKCAEQCRQLQVQCRRRLKNPVRRWTLNYLLNHAQRGCALRENSKSHLSRIVANWRRMLLELGGRLNSKDILRNPDDIFFLRFDELEPVTQGRAAFDVRQVVAARRTQYGQNRSTEPPSVVVGKFDAEKCTPDVIDVDIKTLTGLAVSPGVVTGKARVILRTDTDEQVLAGEVLVAPFTDPGWTPYFVPAAAIVMDQGGLLSHGSIIAREYGIPAVVNVGSATRIIKTGQTIQVDADHGLVRILK
ncbi:MAG: PEP/pyruvate-binding domain-containing protein [Planctomycetota bacterium]|jgi:pyruvate,water dikinase